MHEQNNIEESTDFTIYDGDFNRINTIILPSDYLNDFEALSVDPKNSLIMYPVKNGKISKERFFCVECMKILSNSGGNSSKHIKLHVNKSKKNSLMKQTSSALRNFIYSTAQPLSIIKSNALRRIIELACPEFIPSENWLNVCIEKDKKDLDKIFLERLGSESLIAIGFDEWTHQQKRYLAIVGYCSTYNILLSLKEPNDVKRTSEVLSEEIKRVLQKYSIENKIFCSISDAASVCKKTAKILQLKWYPCICHVLQRVLLAFIKQIDCFDEILQKANYYHDDCQYLSFSPSSNKFKIAKYTNTRWLSVRKTISSILTARQQINEYQYYITEEHDNRNISKEIYNIKKSSFFTNNDFKFCNDVLPILDEFDKALRYFQDDSTNSIFFELQNLIQCYNDIQRAILNSPFFSIEPQFSHEFNSRLEKYQDFLMPLLVAAAILNPMIDIDLLLGNEFSKYKDCGIEMIKTVGKIEPTYDVDLNINTGGRIGKRLMKVHFNEIDSYLHFLKYCPIDENENLDDFWESKKNSYPKLYQLFKTFSLLPTSTGFIERVFSQIKFMIGDRRYTLEPDKFEFLAKAFVHPDLTNLAIAKFIDE